MANSKQVISDDMMKFVTFWATMTIPNYELELPEREERKRKIKKQIVKIEEVSDGKL